MIILLFFFFVLYFTRHEGKTFPTFPNNSFEKQQNNFLIIQHCRRVLTATLQFWMRWYLHYYINVYISNNAIRVNFIIWLFRLTY